MTRLRMRAMLEHARWSDVHDLSGLDDDPGLETSIMIRDLRSEVPTAQGALVVVLYSADRSDWRLDALLSRCTQRGIAAVLVEGHGPLLSSTVALARRLRVPVLGAEDPLRAHQDFVRLGGEADMERAEVTLRVLDRVTGGGTDLTDLLNAVTAALGRPTVLLDGQGTLLAGQPWAGQEASQLVAASPASWLGSQVELEDGALLVAQPVQAAGVHAWLTTRLPAPVPAESGAVKTALRAVVPAIEHSLLLARMARERDVGQRVTVLNEVLQRPETAPTRRRALDLGWQLDGWHTGIRIAVLGEVDLPARRDEVLDAFAAEQLPCVVVEHGDGWSVWCSTQHEPTTSDVQATAAKVRSAHRRLQSTLEVSVGVGRPHPRATGIGQSLAEATDAAALARGRPETGRFMHVDRLGVAQLLLAWTRTDTFQPAARALLQPLVDAPGELVATLAAYLDAESSITETAAVLGVHRNTVAARIARIESLLGIDLASPDERLALHLACRAALNMRTNQTPSP